MRSEHDLLEAMRHSASRADLLADEPSLVTARRRRTRAYALPAAAAATVVALTAGALLVAGRHDPAPRQLAVVSPVSSRTIAATSDAPTPTPRTTLHISPPKDPHVAADISRVLDPVQLHGAGYSNWMLGGNGDVATGSSNIEHPLPGSGRLVEFDVVGPDADFDAMRIPRDHPVAIAGTTGYYSKLALFPLDGSTNDKYLAHWTIAFTTPRGDWAFVHVDRPGDDVGASVADPAAIVAAYDELGVTYTPGHSKVPLRTGFMPSGLHLVNTSFATGEDDSGLVDASFAAGSKTIDIQLAPTHGPADPGGAGCGSPSNGCAEATGIVGGYRVVVGARGYDAATAHAILNTLQAADDPTDQGSYWTLAEAFD